MQLLQDVFIVENLQVINEGKTKDTMRIRGVFGRCNEKNNNGRIYPTTVLENQLKKVQPLIQERRLCGELDHPSNDTVKLSNASHLITKLEIKGNELIGEAEILKTPAGLTAKALIDGGVRIGISSRGMGTLSEDAQGNKVVNEDYRLVTFDLVADPSTRGAFPTLAESTQSKFARESQSKLQKESNFVIMLKSKFRQEFNNVLSESILSEADAKPDDDAMPDDGSDYEETITPYGKTRRRIGTQFKDTGSYWGNLRATSGEIYRMRALAAEKERQKKAAEAAAKPKVPLGQRLGSFVRGVVGNPTQTQTIRDFDAPRAPDAEAPLVKRVIPGTERWRTAFGGAFGNVAKGFNNLRAHTEYHRIGIILAESMGLLEYKDPKTGERYTTPAAAEKYERKYGGGVKQDLGKFGTTEFTKTGEGQILKSKEGKITSVRPHGSKGKLPVPVKLKMKESFIRIGKSLLEKSSERPYSSDPDERVKQRKEGGDWSGSNKGSQSVKMTPEQKEKWFADFRERVKKEKEQESLRKQKEQEQLKRERDKK
jgi:hypothetical protein